MFILFLNLSAISACADIGFTRTPFNNFENVSFQSLGIQMELPGQPTNRHSRYFVKIYDSEAFRRNTNSTALVIFFHPYHMEGFATEPEYYLVFDIEKKVDAEDLFRRFKFVGKLKNVETEDANSEIKEWIGSDEYSGRKYFLFQKNIELPNKEIVSAGAKLLHRPEVNPKEDDDIKFIRRVLNSIRPL